MGKSTLFEILACQDHANGRGFALVDPPGDLVERLAGRAELPVSRRGPFFVYIDEFQSFTTLMLTNMLSEMRKYGVGVTLAHQYFHQLEHDIRQAVLGNAGRLTSFRVGPEDTFLLAQEFQSKFSVQDLINLANRDLYLKLMIDGAPSLPFRARAGYQSNFSHSLQRGRPSLPFLRCSRLIDRPPLSGPVAMLV